jgi:hypothetical protein
MTSIGGDAMTVELQHMRDYLLPGLYEVSMRYRSILTLWEDVFAAGTREDVFAAGTRELLIFPAEVALPSVPAALAAGAAAAVIRNPVVTRRFLPWTKP